MGTTNDEVELRFTVGDSQRIQKIETLLERVALELTSSLESLRLRLLDLERKSILQKEFDKLNDDHDVLVSEVSELKKEIAISKEAHQREISEIRATQSYSRGAAAVLVLGLTFLGSVIGAVIQHFWH